MRKLILLTAGSVEGKRSWTKEKMVRTPETTPITVAMMEVG